MELFETNGSMVQQEVWSWPVTSNSGTLKTIQLIHGDLCKRQEGCDVVVCSAFKNDYAPTFSSLIGALQWQRNISVDDLARTPELDLKAMGCWLSGETGTDFRRIACVELLSHRESLGFDEECRIDLIIRKTFSTLRYLLEQANICLIPMKTVAMPVLGTGDQQIQLPYVLGTLIAQCQAILQTNDGVEKIVFYERDAQRAKLIAEALNTALMPNNTHPLVFLSYSSKQTDVASEIHSLLEREHISCWMAPGSIPPGENYLDIIPAALSQVQVVLLLLTPDAEQSRWVQKEISAAVGADKIVIPYQLYAYDVSNRFRFLLDGEQFLCEQAQTPEQKYVSLLARLHELVDIGHHQC